MDNRAYWIWLQQAFGAGSRMPWKLHRDYRGGAGEFYEGGARLWNTRRDITDQQAAALYSFSLEEAEARLEYAEKVGWQVITPECEKYPEALRNISDPPAALYLKGMLPDVDREPALAVAGARKAVEDSVQAAEKIGFQLAAGGAVVISGNARGVDRAALMGALSACGKTVSVLPVDLGSPYLTENASLRDMIPERGGALVSEYFSQRNPERGTFQVRNRLITGLSCGVLLIQASAKSGTMLYARLAKEQDRDVFVYPGREGGEKFAGSRSLLEDGAKAVTCGEEILEEYALRFRNRKPENPFEGLFDHIPLPEERRPALADPGTVRELTEEEARVLEALGRETLAVAQLEERTGLEAAGLFSVLTELELDGFVISAPGKRYRQAGTVSWN